MITKEYISAFYKAVDRLGLRFPVATISKATKESKGNVSKYLNRKKDPSEEFIKKFYESFPNVSHETFEQPEESQEEEESLHGLLVQLMKMQNHLLQTQNKILEDTREMVSSKIDGIADSVVTISSRQDEIIRPVKTGIAYHKMWMDVYAEEHSKGDPRKKKEIQLQMGTKVLDLIESENGKDKQKGSGK